MVDSFRRGRLNDCLKGLRVDSSLFRFEMKSITNDGFMFPIFAPKQQISKAIVKSLYNAVCTFQTKIAPNTGDGFAGNFTSRSHGPAIYICTLPFGGPASLYMSISEFAGEDIAQFFVDALNALQRPTEKSHRATTSRLLLQTEQFIPLSIVVDAMQATLDRLAVVLQSNLTEGDDKAVLTHGPLFFVTAFGRDQEIGPDGLSDLFTNCALRLDDGTLDPRFTAFLTEDIALNVHITLTEPTALVKLRFRPREGVEEVILEVPYNFLQVAFGLSFVPGASVPLSLESPFV